MPKDNVYIGCLQNINDEAKNFPLPYSLQLHQIDYKLLYIKDCHADSLGALPVAHLIT